MAPLLAILNALRRSVQRHLATFQSLRANNFFLFVALLIWGAAVSGVEPKSAEPLLLLLSCLLLFPISSDPLANVPPDRLALWPLTPAQRVSLRLASFGLSPITWMAILILLTTARAAIALFFLLAAIGAQAVVMLGRQAAQRDPHWNLLRHIPPVPGRLGGVIRNDIRETLSLLDPYVAACLAAGATAYRFLAASPDPAAFPILSLLVALALSTYTQSLFGLDSGSGMTRYRLLPLRGWEILLAKDIAFLALLFVLVLPITPWPGFTFGLTALAIGHHYSVLTPLRHRRWRFADGRILPVGMVQVVGGTVLGFAEHERGAWVLILTGIAWLGSLFFYGWRWERFDRGGRWNP